MVLTTHGSSTCNVRWHHACCLKSGLFFLLPMTPFYHDSGDLEGREEEALFTSGGLRGHQRNVCCLELDKSSYGSHTYLHFCIVIIWQHINIGKYHSLHLHKSVTIINLYLFLFSTVKGWKGEGKWGIGGEEEMMVPFFAYIHGWMVMEHLKHSALAAFLAGLRQECAPVYKHLGDAHTCCNLASCVWEEAGIHLQTTVRMSCLTSIW